MNLHTYQNPDDVANAVACWMINYIDEALKKQPFFSLVLSGGSTPKKLYQLLSSETYKRQIDWNKIHIFFGDERFVPFDDERNNAKMAYDSLLNHVSILRESIHAMQTENITHEDSAKSYELLLQRYFQQSTNTKQQTFDLVLLGMGDDAHTLSLFPGNKEVIFEQEKWCTSLWLEKQNMQRITLTAAVVNQSARIAFLVTGDSKAKALHEVLKGEFNPVMYPSQIINPVNGELHWFIDEAAALKL